MAEHSIQKIGWWHERLADWMIANPDKRLKDAAVVFDCSVPWISIIKNSDAFKEYWLTRSNLASERNDTNTLVAKTAAIADLALDRLLEKVACPHEVMQATQLLEIADTTMKRLGYGVKPPTSAGGGQPTAAVNLTINISPEKLAAAREKMKRVHGVEVAEIAIPSSPPELELDMEILPPSKAIRSVG